MGICPVSPYWLSYSNPELKVEIVKTFKKLNIETRDWWSRGLHNMPAFPKYNDKHFPITEKVADSSLGLPFFRDMRDSDFDRIHVLFTNGYPYMVGNFIPVSLCPTGMISKKGDNPNVPISAQEIIEDVKRCHEIGITSVHIHARREDETPAWEKFYFEKIVSGIRGFDENIIICVTTSGRDVQEIEKRSEVLTLAGECKPDMASLTLSSMNFLNQASVNDPGSIQTLAKMMLDLEIKPELEIFDMGMINYANYLIKKNLLKPPYVINLLLGNISGLQPEFLDLGLAIERIPKPSIHFVAGLGNFQRKSNILGILSDGGVRVGLEDNIFTNHETKKLANNVELLHGVNEIAKVLGKKIMTGQEFKRMYLRS